jgi:hypothetical protein
MGFLHSIAKLFFYTSLLGFSLMALYVGDLHRSFLEPVVPHPMFSPPPYKAVDTATDSRIPKWTERELIDRELEIDEYIAKLETRFYSLRYHQQEPDTNSYRGGKNSAGEREGIGRVELPNGDIYMGEWKKNLRHGIGGLVLIGGDTYECEWAFGDPHGFGSHRTAEGYHYIGEFVAGQPNGFGRALYGQKAYYMGRFREGKPHGFGNWTNGETRYEGEFVEGKRNGQGRLSSYQGGNTLYEGLFRNDLPLRAGWQPKPKYMPDPDTNTEQSLGTTESYDPTYDTEQEVIQMPLRAGGTFGN